MTSNRNARVYSVFANRDDAENAFERIEEAGCSMRDVSLIMSNDPRRGDEIVETAPSHELLEGAGLASTVAAVTGGIAASVAAIGTNFIIPGVGIIAGPLAAGLLGAGGGAVAGGLIGALTVMGVPDGAAPDYEKAINEGGVILAITPRSWQEADALETELKRLGAIRADRF